MDKVTPPNLEEPEGKTTLKCQIGVKVSVSSAASASASD